ncbi:hypothetical protein D3C77_519070 [compost metagenome]
MGGGNHVDRQVEPENLGNLRCHQATERCEDVGVVALALLEQFDLVHFVVKQMFIAVVLAEGIIAEQHRIAGDVGHHAVWPVEHRRFDKNQLFAVADIQRVTGTYDVEVPLGVMVMAIDRLHAIGGAVDRRVGDLRHQLSQRPGMVLFGMVDNDIVEGVEVDFGCQVLDEFAAELVIDRINQHSLLFTNQVAVIAAAFEGLVFGAMKIPHFPIALTNPVNIAFDVNGHVAASDVELKVLHRRWQGPCQIVCH